MKRSDRAQILETIKDKLFLQAWSSQEPSRICNLTEQTPMGEVVDTHIEWVVILFPLKPECGIMEEEIRELLASSTKEKPALIGDLVSLIEARMLPQEKRDTPPSPGMRSLGWVGLPRPADRSLAWRFCFFRDFLTGITL